MAAPIASTAAMSVLFVATMMLSVSP